MQMTFFRSTGWAGWDVTAEPAIADRMPVLVDDDLLFEDAGVARPSVAANRWLRELPVSGAPSPATWATYARVLRDWMSFLPGIGVEVFDTRERLKDALSAYAAHHATGPVEARFAASTWNQHVSVLSGFYQWAASEGEANPRATAFAGASSPPVRSRIAWNGGGMRRASRPVSRPRRR